MPLPLKLSFSHSFCIPWANGVCLSPCSCTQVLWLLFLLFLSFPLCAHEARGHCQVPSVIVSHRTQNSLIQLSWLARDTQGSACLCLEYWD